MTLEEQLVANVPRDRSGSLASGRFEFQKNWALCELLLLHQRGGDYVMTFDHHEDVSVLNAEKDPSEYRAYQIKTKANGSWTAEALTKRPSGTGGQLPSILAKLCGAMTYLSGSVKLLQFVSNAPYRIQLAVNNKCDLTATLIAFEDIAGSKRKEIAEALKTELPTISMEDLSGTLQLKVTDLSLNDHAAHTKGKLAEALEQLFPGKAFSITPIYRAIVGEITALNNNSEDVSSYQQYLRKKSLSRARFTEILQACGVTRQTVDWPSVEARLNSENAPLPQVLGLKKEWDTVRLDRLEKREDVQHVAMLAAVREAVQQAKSIPSLIKAIEAAIGNLKRRTDWRYSDEYLQTCIVVYLYES